MDKIRYLREIVEPTVADFRGDPSSVRLGFLACVVIDHFVDYLVFPTDALTWTANKHHTKRKKRREQLFRLSGEFLLVSEVANAIKHVKTRTARGLEAGEVYERPPAVAGRMMTGVSMIGDTTGGVVVDDQDLLPVVEQALVFISQQ